MTPYRLNVLDPEQKKLWSRVKNYADYDGIIRIGLKKHEFGRTAKKHVVHSFSSKVVTCQGPGRLL